MSGARALLLFCVFAILGGCQDIERVVVGSLAQAERVASRAGFQAERYPAGQFELLGYERFGSGAHPTLVVYLESDGFIRTNRNTLSPDPTPLRPLTLEMAAHDDSPKVLYLARPCQYQSAERLRACSPLYWDVRRFSPEVVTGLSQALDRAKTRARAQRLILIGYSGGGTLAALLAARRDDIDGIATIAAPLDVEAWVRHHAISPVAGALDAAALAALARTRQIHMAGVDDWQVPPGLAEAYLRRLPARHNARLVALPRHDHDCCWVESWPGLLAREVRPWLAAAPAR